MIFVDESSIIIYCPSTFCPTLDHHHGGMYYKCDVTFVYILLLCKKSVCTIWFVGFYGISTLVGYLKPNPFLYK